MEGPTPSSAIFYGALSVHAGAFLMLRIEPLIAQSPLAQALCVLAGAITSLWASNAARAACDAKSAIALATSTQLGLIFVEIGLGLTTFALIHMMGNAIVRLVQFLRAPSVLLEHQQIHDEAGGQLAPVGKPFRVLVPEGAERIAYALAVNPHNLDAALDRLLAPLLRIGRALDSTLSHK